jgi:hypothetical protein
VSKVIHPDRGEELIDLALETYTAREADAGLEDRILARATAVRPRIEIGRWRWTMAAAASIAVVALFSFWLKWQHLEIAFVHPPAVTVTGRQTPVSERGGTATAPGAGTAEGPSGESRPKRQSSLPEQKAALQPAYRTHEGGQTPAAETETAENAEPVAPIVLKPIVFAPIRIGGAR